MNVIFDIGGEHHVLLTNQAIALIGELCRQDGLSADGPGADLAAAIVIEHHLVERSDEPIHLLPKEGRAVLAAIFSARGRLYGPQVDALEARRRSSSDSTRPEALRARFRMTLRRSGAMGTARQGRRERPYRT